MLRSLPASCGLVTATRSTPCSTGGRCVDRVAGIDAPEAGQAFGERARRSLADMVTKRDVDLHLVGVDVHERPLAVLSVQGVSVNVEMVRLRWALVYRRFTDDAALIAFEDTARSNRWGLWADPHPTPPWEFRRNVQDR